MFSVDRLRKTIQKTDNFWYKNYFSDVTVHPKPILDSRDSYSSLTTDTTGMSDYEFTFNSTRGDLIVDHAQTELRDLQLTSNNNGKKQFKIDIEGKVRREYF